jgi:hypothetical protein
MSCAYALWLFSIYLGGELRAVFAFRVDGPGGGNWYVRVSPSASESGSGPPERAGLTLHLRSTDMFCERCSRAYSGSTCRWRC